MENYWQWAGHIARLDKLHPLRRAATWRDARWWEWWSEFWSKSDPYNSLGWRRPTTARPRRWERSLVEIFGNNWERFAGNRRWWKKHEGKFTKHILNKLTR